jgi:hypothetical protein
MGQRIFERGLGGGVGVWQNELLADKRLDLRFNVRGVE